MNPSSGSAKRKGPGGAGLARQTVADQMADAVRERILSGELPENAPIRQDRLAEELGASRIPVREALRQLEAEGLVTFSPHRGAVVSALSLDEIGELFELRALVEEDLLRRAVPRMSDDALKRAEELLEAYDQAFERRDVADWGALNWAFHATLYAPSERPLTMEVVRRLHSQADRYVRLQIKLTEWETRAHEEHRAMLQAARDGDSEGATGILRDHILSAGTSLIEFLRAHRKQDEEASGARSAS